MVAGLGGADEVVVGDVEVGPGRGEAGSQLVGPVLRGEALLLGGPGHLLPVLVGAGEEEDVVADQAVPAGQGVGVDRGVGVPDVGRVLDVVDRCGDVEAGHCPVAYRPGRDPDLTRPGPRTAVPAMATTGPPTARRSGSGWPSTASARTVTGHVLLVRAARYLTVAGRWFLPGGGIDHGEDPVDGPGAGVRRGDRAHVEVGELGGALRRVHPARRGRPAHRQDRLRHRVVLRRTSGTKPTARPTPPGGDPSTR